MITKDGARCATCGSEAPKWVEESDFDGYEGFDRAYGNWESIHDQCDYWEADDIGWRGHENTK